MIQGRNVAENRIDIPEQNSLFWKVGVFIYQLTQVSSVRIHARGTFYQYKKDCP